MKDKVLTLQTGEEYYVLEELDYQNNKYVIGSICNLETEKMNENEYIIFQVTIKDDRLALDDILDDNLANTVSKKIMEKMIKS